MKSCSEGETAFDSAWKELKESGYLIQHKKNVGNRFVYEYELIDKKDDLSGGGFPGVENTGMENIGGENKEGDNTADVKRGAYNNQVSNKDFIKNIDKDNTNIILSKETNDDNYFSLLKEPDKNFSDNPLTDEEKYRISTFIQQIDKNQIKTLSTCEDIICVDKKIDELLLALNSLFIQQGKYTTVGVKKYYTSDIKRQLLNLTPIAIATVLKNICNSNSKNIKNVNAYIQTALINATYSQGSLYTDLVNPLSQHM